MKSPIRPFESTRRRRRRGRSDRRGATTHPPPTSGRAAAAPDGPPWRRWRPEGAVPLFRPCPAAVGQEGAATRLWGGLHRRPCPGCAQELRILRRDAGASPPRRPRLSRARSGRQLSRRLPAGAATPSRRVPLPACTWERGGPGRRRPSARAAASLGERRPQAGQVEAEAPPAPRPITGIREVGGTFHRFGRSARSRSGTAPKP